MHILLRLLVLVVAVQALPASEPALVLHLYCLEVQPSVLEHFGEDRATGTLPAQVSSATAFSLLDTDAVHVLGALTLTCESGHDTEVDHSHAATYLEPTASGGLVQRESDWKEGLSARISAHRDSEGRIRIDGQVTLSAIDSREAISGAEHLPIGKPLTHSTHSIVPGAVLRSGEACVIPFPSSASPAPDRVVVVVAE